MPQLLDGHRPDVDGHATDDHRPDVDGLRALAVMSVLFFNLRKIPRGGFVGVDIFFVISGYGVALSFTAHNKKDASASSCKDRVFGFWGRRVKRLMPANLFTTFSIAVLISWLFPPWNNNLPSYY